MRRPPLTIMLGMTALCTILETRLCRAQDAHADPDNRHRFSLGGAYAPLSYTVCHPTVGEDLRDKEPTGHVRVGYGYLAVGGFEIGGAVTAIFSHFDTLLAPMATLRGFASVGGDPRIELGASLRAGMMIAPSHTDIGPAVSGGPEVRVWATRSLGFTFGGSATLAQGSSGNSNHRIVYLSLAAVELAVTVTP